MLHSFFKQAGVKAFVFASLFITVFAANAKAGLDSYSIYLNNKLVLKQSVQEPLNLSGLRLTAANANDKLVIYYSDCHAPNKIGNDRRIVVKDNKGNIVKQWKFADAASDKSGMVIPVKELLVLEKLTRGILSLVYASQQRPNEQPLAGIKFG